MPNSHMTFGVDLLPKSGANTYNLGNSNQKWSLYTNQINDTDLTNTNIATTEQLDNLILIQTTEPTDPDVKVWINPNGDNSTLSLQDKIEIMTPIAPVEQSTTASTSYDIGSYFIYNDILYKVTKKITSGETIVTSGSNQNCEATKTGQEISTIQNKVNSLEATENILRANRVYNTWTFKTWINNSGEQGSSTYGISTNEYYTSADTPLLFQINPEYVDIYKVNIAVYQYDGTFIKLCPQLYEGYAANELLDNKLYDRDTAFTNGMKYKATLMRIDNNQLSNSEAAIDWNNVLIVTTTKRAQNSWSFQTYIKPADGTQATSPYGVSTNEFYFPKNNKFFFNIHDNYKSTYMVQLFAYTSSGEFVAAYPPNVGNAYSASALYQFYQACDINKGYKYKATIMHINSTTFSDNEKGIDWNNVLMVNYDDPVGTLTTSKTWEAIGDSITWINDRIEPTYPARGYIDRLRDRIKFRDVYNKAINGSNMLTYNLNNLTVADIYTINLGINDWGARSPVGTIADYKAADGTQSSNFAQCLKRMILKIRTLNSGAFIILMTPRRAYGFNDYLPAHSTDPNASGAYLYEYVDIINEVGKIEGIPVVDQYYKSGINDSNLVNYSYDVALHPNGAGMQIIANMLYPVFEQYLCEQE